MCVCASPPSPGPRWRVQVAGSHELQLAQPREGCGGTSGGRPQVGTLPLHASKVLFPWRELLSQERRWPWESAKPRPLWNRTSSCETHCPVQPCHLGLCRDVAGGSLAAAGTEKLSKAWGMLVLAKELGGEAPGLCVTTHMCPSCKHCLYYLRVTKKVSISD